MNVVKSKNTLKILSLIFCIAILLGIAMWEYNERINEEVKLVRYSYSHKDIPSGFNGYKIFVISDLHNAPFGDKIIRDIEDKNPDVVVIVGDIVQLPDCNFSETEKIASELKGKIPVYAVSGNHETQNDDYWYIRKSLEDSGVKWLENDSAILAKNGDRILLTGLMDPEHTIVTPNQCEELRDIVRDELPDDEECFSVLLQHRANLYPELKDSGADLILSGHLHGGVVRLPFVGGVAGEEGIFEIPEYEYGFIEEGNSASMIVSGGCDKNPRKKRWFNQPEVLLITLESE